MTLSKRIIPALHVDRDDDGNAMVCAGAGLDRLSDAGNPVEMARAYDDDGADEVVFLDVTASAERRKTMFDVARAVADELFVPLTIGGGISTTGDIKNALQAGADKVSINTAALSNAPIVEEGAGTFGSQCIVVSVDARRRFDERGEYHVTVGGESCWFEAVPGTGKRTGVDAIAWASEAAQRGAGELIVTSLDARGTAEGYDIPLVKAVCDVVSLPVIASGGCGTPEHARDVFADAGADAALGASVFHTGAYSIREFKTYLANHGVPIRT